MNDHHKNSETETIFTKLGLLSISYGILLIFITLLIFGIIAWAIWGCLPIKVEGSGIVSNKQGLTEVVARIEGTVAALKVHSGQVVKKGDLLVELINPAISLKFESIKIKLQNLQNEYDRLKKQINIEKTAIQEALKREIAANDFVIQQVEQQAKSLAYEWDLRKKLYEKGLISYPKVQMIEVAFVQQEIDLETLKEKKASLIGELEKGYRVEELAKKKWEIEDSNKELAILNAQIDLERVYSPANGVVISHVKDVGELVQQGDSLIILEQTEDQVKDLVIYGYFSIEQGKDIVEGTPVEIEFAQFLENEYGRLLGVVQKISNYAVSTEHLMNNFYNQEIIDRLMKPNSAALEVIVSPLKNPNHPEEYLWTAGSAPHIPITTGSFCLLFAVVQEVRPIYFIFPLDTLKWQPLVDPLTPIATPVPVPVPVPALS